MDQRMGNYLIISAVCLVISMMPLTASAAGGNDLEELKELLSSLNDPKMSVLDMAFFLATHNYDARPAKDYVELKLDGKVYKLVPNGDSGLCKVIPLE